MKRIDIHAHAVAFPELTPRHRYTGERFLSAEELTSMYDRFGIERGVLLPIVSPEAQCFLMTPEGACTLSRQNPDRFSWFCNVDPRAVDHRPSSDLGYLLEHYKNLGAKGVGEVTANLYADDPKMENLFEACTALGLPVLIHIAPHEGGLYGIIDELNLPRIEKILKKYPDLTLIGHSQPFWSEISADNTDEIRNGYPKGKVTEGRIAALMREYPGLCCDLSAGSGCNALTRDPDYAAGFLTEFADRIYYGCDICASFNDHPARLNAFLDSLVQSCGISRETYEKICFRNAEQLLGLN
ncbi:MAG: amidohydrolase family protein [Clostridia bacterium]|nr:amidohydrolase family protein [Clostridia bacterium]